MIEASSLTLRYSDAGTEVSAVDQVSLSIADRSFVGVCGPSGSGKSSLLYLLSGLKLPTSGAVRYGEKILSELSMDDRARVRRQSFGFVFQSSFLIPYLTVLENVLSAVDQTGPAERDRAAVLLEGLGLEKLARRFPYQVSAGERQRTSIARAIFHRPDIVFADEPTAALDRETADRVVELLREHTSGGTLVLVTHDESILQGAATVFRMFGGKIQNG